MLAIMTVLFQCQTGQQDSDANCSGDEDTLRECSLTYYSNCDSYTGVGVNCHAQG